MERSALPLKTSPPPAARDVLALLKPITWFPPMWAFAVGVVSSGASIDGRWILVAGGVLLAGPMVCGTSQAVNDWFDRHVDAINEPDRPIPSGRIAGRWGLFIAIAGTLLSLALAAALGPLVLGAAVIGLAYEGLSWFTGATVMLGAMPSASVLTVLLLYSLGAHGIMTLNDFKAVEGDRATGLRSLPVVLGVRRASLLACATMAGAQAIVVALLLAWGLTLSAVIVAALLTGQFALMPKLLRNPARNAPWYGATGVTLYVLGMLAAGLGLGGYI